MTWTWTSTDEDILAEATYAAERREGRKDRLLQARTRYAEMAKNATSKKDAAFFEEKVRGIDKSLEAIEKGEVR